MLQYDNNMICKQYAVSVLVICFLDISYLAPTVFGYVTQPHVQDLKNGHTLIGEDIELECTVSSNKHRVLMEWDSPLNLKLTLDRVNITTWTQKVSPTLYTIKSIYSVRPAKLEDQRVYYCRVADIDNIYDNKYAYTWVSINKKNEHYIKFYDEYIFDEINGEVKVLIAAHPKPTFQWFDNNDRRIESNNSTHEVELKSSNRFSNYEVFLKFDNISNEDFGDYTLVVENGFEQKNLTVSVNITEPSSSVMLINTSNSSKVIKCQAIGYPRPQIFWVFYTCKDLSCFSKQLDKDTISDNIDEDDFETDGLKMNSYISLKNNHFGIMRCVSNNSEGESMSQQYVYNVTNGFEVYSRNIIQNGSFIKIEALYHEYAEIMCAVSLRDYFEEIKWYRNGRNMSLDDIRVPIKGFDEYTIKNVNAVYSSVSRVMVNIDKSDEDTYICKATRKNGNIESKNITIFARDLPVLNVATNLQNKTLQATLGTTWKFYCNVDGYPTPAIKWLKNNKTVIPTKQMEITDRNQTLAIHSLEPTDNGTYSCVISNRLNQTVSKVAFLETIEPGFDWLLVGIILLSLVLVVVVIFTAFKMRKEYKINKELREAGLYNFEQGAIESLDPKLPLENQANLLPYDKKWEIPSENLTLGKELGSGAFGVVYQGELRGLPTDEDTTIVAVKSVNKFADYQCMKALASELKIMAHLGKHINVVNLIGACTKDIIKKKLLVVVEFCPHGNLHEYILRNSRRFVDLRNTEMDQFDWKLRVKTDESEKNSKSLNYSTLSFSNSGDSDCTENSGHTQIEIKEIEHQDEKDNITSKDLLTWAFQVSKGMEYLSSRRVLHGDLAARNLLLTDNNVVKISDFGLAKSLYKNGIYQKRGKGPLPVKWLAIESIESNIFSTQSDVWSFGIVLWEFFSLAKTPYPGMPVDQTFYKLLFSGYRMDKPEYSTQELYNIMLECWDVEPMKRPNFTQLGEKIASLLEESLVNHYLSMNSPYVDMNSQVKSQEDYLLMISPPTFENTVPDSNYASNLNYFHSFQTQPRYVNINLKTLERNRDIRSSM